MKHEKKRLAGKKRLYWRSGEKIREGENWFGRK